MDYSVDFICSQNSQEGYNDNLGKLGIECHSTEINNQELFNSVSSKLEKPEMCFYDTFIAEEYFR